jgi:outer membrane receptor protein involved in Fe transport
VNVTYDHTVHLPGGSTLTPHGDARLLSSNENSLISAQTYAAGGEPYVHVGTQVVGDLSLNWASAGGAYSLTGYVRNVADNRYKALVNPLNLAQGANFNVPASLYDPRTYGVIASVHF